MNFKSHFSEGREGKNVGLDTGIDGLTKAIKGIQRARLYGVAAAPKVGKTKLTDHCFILAPYEQMAELGKLDDIEWIYYSFEIGRVQKEFDFAAHYFAKDHGIFNFKSEDGNIYKMSANYLMGQELDAKLNPIRVSDEHFEILKTIYVNRIVPLFGEFDELGRQIRPGKITFIRESDNPTGIRNYLMGHAVKHGKFNTQPYNTFNAEGRAVVKERTVSYTPRNPNKYTIVITDHIRKLKPERNFTKKENVDKYIEYQVEIRDLCKYTFVDIIHSNRNLSSIERLKWNSEFIYPTGDDTKDTGNLSEDADYFITMFNPNDEKYSLKKHFGIELENYPNYRSIHLVESRHTECPRHIKTNMFGGVVMFEQLKSN